MLLTYSSTDERPSRLADEGFSAYFVIAYFINNPTASTQNTVTYYGVENGEDKVQQARKRDEFYVPVAPSEHCESGLSR
jgi:hypothetical protein